MREQSIKEKVRPLYSELQGYLSQAPPDEKHDIIHDESIWSLYNDSVRSLNKVSGVDYSRFIITSHAEGYITVSTYRQKLGGLISSLHAEYFSDEPAPFSGGPSTVITQTQQQSQSVQMLLDIQSKIDEVLPRCEAGSPEQGFLQRLKDSLSTVSNVKELFNLCFKLAKEFGLSITTLMKLFM